MALPRFPMVMGPPASARLLAATEGNTGRIFIEDSGAKEEATTLVCFPGIGDTRHTYRHLATGLLPSCRIILADLRGFGDSAGTYATYTPEAVAADYKYILDQLALERNVVLVGNSLAAGSALLAADHPAVKGVILVGPILRDLPPDKYFRPISHALFVWPWGASMWGSFFLSLFKRDIKPEGHESHVATVKKALREKNALSSVGKFVRASKKGVELNLGRVKKPVLLALGDSDPDYPDPAAELEWMKQALKSAVVKVALLTKVGHYPHLEAPDETLPAVMDFLASIQ